MTDTGGGDEYTDVAAQGQLELGQVSSWVQDVLAELAEVRPLLLAGLVFHVPHALEAGADVAEEDEVDGTTRARRPRRGRFRSSPSVWLCVEEFHRG